MKYLAKVKNFTKKVNIFILIIFSLTFSVVRGYSQKVIEVEVEWCGISQLQMKEDLFIKYPCLTPSAGYVDYKEQLPYLYYQHESVASSYTHSEVEILDYKYSPLTKDEKDFFQNNPELENKIDSELAVKSKVLVHRKSKLNLVELIPYISVSGEIQKLTSVRFTTNFESRPKGGFRAPDFAENSVLASGEWYRISVNREGVFRLDYDFLKSIGVDVDNISPNDINVYGQEGGILPFQNDEPRYDDLEKMAVLAVGDEDNSFDPGDYFLLYAQGPVSWKYNDTIQGFWHQTNYFSNRNHYFIGIGTGTPKRMQTVSSTTQPATHTVTAFNDFDVHERDLVNLTRSGRRWYGEEFDMTLQRNVSFDFPNIVTSAPAYAHVTMAGFTHASSCSFNIQVSGDTRIVTISGVSSAYWGPKGRRGEVAYQFSPNSSSLNFSLTFNKQGFPNAKGWLDYIAVNVRRQLIMSGNQMLFRDVQSWGDGNVAEYNLASATSVEHLWDVTDIHNVNIVEADDQGGAKVFRFPSDELKTFLAHTGSGYLNPISGEKIDNQNLHGLDFADFVIISHPNFLSAANELADYRRGQGMTVHVVTPQQIYNEFSSGTQDITAFKMFMKMFYDRANSPEDMPKNLLLFGNATYDYKNINGDGGMFVPSYQSANSLSQTVSYVSDDYFGFLDDEEGEGLWDLVDIGIGRLPIKTPEEARNMVSKVKSYESMVTDMPTGESCDDGVGDSQNEDWKNVISFVADDEESVSNIHMHLEQSERIVDKVTDEHPVFNINKIYFDAFQQESTPGGQRYPDVNNAIDRRVDRGALIMNYTGHGGVNGWAHERVLTNSMINDWSNGKRMPLFVTATCEFARFDDPASVSAGELVVLNPNGGGIGLLTTTRLVYASPNEVLNTNFFDYALDFDDDGKPRCIGEITQLTKRATSGSINSMNFTLLGDPTVRLNYPTYKVNTTEINGVSVTQTTDTLKALSHITVSGEIVDENNQVMTDFNGVIFPLVFDKMSEVETLGNNSNGGPTNYEVFNNQLFRGKASVTNGQFEFSFVVPKDISFAFGPGRLSYYAFSGSKEANGYNHDIIVGGSDENAAEDNEGPEIELYMNDESFVFGGLTDETPLLLAKLFDQSGINTTGAGIGHDLTATLNEKTDQRIILNDYYESDMDTYQSGQIRYQFSELEEGPYTLKLKAWDVHNNSSEELLEFVVARSEEMALSHVLNYPNPFTTRTQFMFEHNQICSDLRVQIQVYTVSGKLVKTLNEHVRTNGYRADPIEWDGRDDFGDRLGRGVYVYKVAVLNPDGEKAEKYEKLVILN